MQRVANKSSDRAVILSSAALLASASLTLGDIMPVSRLSNLSASSYQSVGAGGIPITTSQTDSNNTLDYYSNSIGSGGSASQTSYLTSDGAYARVSAFGYQSGSIQQPNHGEGTSSFVYTFNLTAPTTLNFTGTLFRGSPFIAYGSVLLWNTVTNTLVYHSIGNTSGFETVTSISDMYAAAPGTYRFEVSITNYGGSAGGFPAGASGADILMTPTPGAAAVLALGALGACRRRRP